jgi:hypothetical protein
LVIFSIHQGIEQEELNARTAEILQQENAASDGLVFCFGAWGLGDTPVTPREHEFAEGVHNSYRRLFFSARSGK